MFAGQTRTTTPSEVDVSLKEALYVSEGEGGGAQGRPAASDDTIAAAQVGDVLTVTIDRVGLFERNSRLLENEAYADLRGSLVATRGCARILPVTRRPASDALVLSAGNNTTVAVLRELYETTGDPAFGTVQVQLTAYEGELSLLDAHDRENGARGRLSFGERAVEKYRKWLLWFDEEEQVGRTPTISSFVRRDNEACGSNISRNDFRLYKFFAEQLAPYVPFHLVHVAFGRVAVRELRSLFNAGFTVWQHHALGSDGEYLEL